MTVTAYGKQGVYHDGYLLPL